MKKSIVLTLMLILTFSTLLSADSVSPLDAGNVTAQIDYVPGELLVKYKTQFRAAASVFYKTRWNISTIQLFKSTGCRHVKLPQAMTVEQAMDMYCNDPDVEYAEPNYIYHATRTPNDINSNRLWGLNNIGQPVNGTSGTIDADIDATEAWDIVTGSDTVIIAVVDSGVNWNHEDLAGNIWSNTDEALNGGDTDGNGYIDDIRGWDFVDNDNDPTDYNGHGTHVAGTIAAVGNNSSGVTGVCWKAKILPIRSLDAAGSGPTSNLMSAIEYANANGAHVINNSWGGGGYSQSTKTAIDQSSAIVVCAAGNDGTNNESTHHYPSDYTSDNIISVAATDQDDDIASFSCYGAISVDVGAPGTNIYSTDIARHDVFTDDFNDGNINGWTTGGTSNWGVENGYLTESLSGNYANNTDSWVMSSAINVSSVPNNRGIRLEFQLRGISQRYYDFLYVQTSSNGSTGWTTHAQLSGSTGVNWYPFEYDISNYAGGNVYIRFRFTSNGSINYDGWRIDNVKVTAYTPGTNNSYNFKNGTSMATPIVSGIAGLIKATTSAITNTEIKAAIEQNVDSNTSLSGRVATNGRVNANNIFATAPSVLAATAVSGSQINLTWNDNSSNEDGFRIERKTGAGGTWSQVDTVATNITSYSNTGLSELTTYYYRVCSHKTGVNSPSNEANATTPMGAPSSLDASTFSDTEIDLTWTDNSNIETGFRIERATASGGPFTIYNNVGANVTTYRSSGLSASTEYYYRVTAYTVGDNSSWSNEANATTLDPNAPSGLTATAASASQINLTWTDNSLNETGFRIERKTGSGTYAEVGSVGVGIETYSDTGLSASTEYYYMVIAFNAGVDLAASNEANATTQAPPSDGGGDGGGGSSGGGCFISTATSGL